jgi:hypothetical protein
MPKADPKAPVQQLGYITVLPDHASGASFSLSGVTAALLRMHPEQLFPNFDSFSQMMEKLNHHLQQKPLPGHTNYN